MGTCGPRQTDTKKREPMHLFALADSASAVQVGDAISLRSKKESQNHGFNSDPNASPSGVIK